MALPSTIFKVELSVSDLDRNYYAEHSLTLARHPSETDERMMARLAAFALNADDALAFTRGLCAEDEPAMWRKGLTGDIDLWVEVGLPDPKRLRKASTRSRQVALYLYGGNTAHQWWLRHADVLGRLANLDVVALQEEGLRAFTGLVRRSMRLQCTIQDGQLYVSDDVQTVHLPTIPLKTTEG